MASSGMGPLTQAWADYVGTFKAADVPEAVRARAIQMILDGSGALLAAADPKISTGRLIAKFAADLGGAPDASVIGHGFKTNVVNAALANGTMGYACDVEPHHPEGVLHPIAVMIPTALAVSELTGADGAQFVAAVVLGCEIEYRLSMALGPVEQYNLGFHPSAVTGCFGATAAASFLLGLNADQVTKAFGLAGCQASGLMAWESDETENSRPFQMGMAARNGVTSAMLASRGFGGPIGIFDHGHTVFRAFSRKPAQHHMTDELGVRFDGIMELAIKPYSSVSFLHPGLDSLLGIARREMLKIEDVEAITLRFPSSGTHCIDNNPLKSHCAQYILPVALSREGLRVVDLFNDRRKTDAEVARLSERVTVIKDDELDKGFPNRYETVVEVKTKSGKTFSEKNGIARGYPEAPMSEADIRAKFNQLAGTIARPARITALAECIAALWSAKDIKEYAALMGAVPDA
ncbi:MAG TPA: MmgE/PrpD family protein [Alphaproteobacteria bacterium]|nr:MmgE/PrpD family protein [Alphaproteobacteria bacterium]